MWFILNQNINLLSLFFNDFASIIPLEIQYLVDFSNSIIRKLLTTGVTIIMPNRFGSYVWYKGNHNVALFTFTFFIWFIIKKVAVYPFICFLRKLVHSAWICLKLLHSWHWITLPLFYLSAFFPLRWGLNPLEFRGRLSLALFVTLFLGLLSSLLMTFPNLFSVCEIYLVKLSLVLPYIWSLSFSTSTLNTTLLFFFSDFVINFHLKGDKRINHLINFDSNHILCFFIGYNFHIKPLRKRSENFAGQLFIWYFFTKGKKDICNGTETNSKFNNGFILLLHLQIFKFSCEELKSLHMNLRGAFMSSLESFLSSFAAGASLDDSKNIFVCYILNGIVGMRVTKCFFILFFWPVLLRL